MCFSFVVVHTTEVVKVARMFSPVPLYNAVRTVGGGSPFPGDTKGAVLFWIVLSRSDLQSQ